jgi:phage tail sheath protein FI
MSNQLLSSKVIVSEQEPNVRPVDGVATSVAGMLGITERGPIGVPTLVTSPDEYRKIFGGYVQNADLPIAVAGFYENGGAQLWIVRTCHYATGVAAAVKGSVTFKDDPGNTVDTLKIEGKTPGAYANSLTVAVKAATSGEADLFDVTVSLSTTVLESWPNLSMDPANARYVQTVINDANAGSDYIAAVAMDVTAPYARPKNGSAAMTLGDDGLTGLADTDFIGSATDGNGLRAFDTVLDLSLLAVPGRATAALHVALLDYCQDTRGGSVFPVLDPPANQTAAAMVTYVKTTANILNKTEFGAIYWPRIKVLNPKKSVFGSAEQITVYPSGHILGVYVRKDASRAGGVYESPAGIEDGVIRGCLGFETNECLLEEKRDLVYPNRINPLTSAPGQAPYIDGSRTLKGNGNFPYIGERRGAIFIEQSLKQALQFARHKNNTEDLRAQVFRTSQKFLLDQMNVGAFRSKEPAKAFFVDVSETLNPPSLVFQGKLRARYGLATNKPAEFIILEFTQDTRALDEELAAG